MSQNPKSIEKSLDYLRKNRMSVEVVDSLQECVLRSLKDRPDYVLLSYGHDNEKVTMLHKLLGKACHSNIVAFAELLTTPVERKLHKATVANVLYPPISGPKLYRKLASIESKRIPAADQVEDTPIHVKSEEPATPKPSIHVKSTGPEEKKDALLHVKTSDKSKTKANLNSWDSKTSKKVQRLTKDHKVHSVDVLSGNNIQALSDHTTNAILSTISPSEEGGVTEVIGVAENVLCLSIDSEQFKGYVVSAFADVERCKDFVFEIQKKLVNFLAAEGVEVELSDINDLQVQGIEFLEWAEEEAEFLKIADHNGDEIAMAFFRDDNKSTSFLDSANAEMVQVSVDDINTAEPVQCDVYLHLPMNDRYLLYAKSGQRVLDNQVPRLKRHNVTNLHIQRDDIQEFKRYMATNFVSQKKAS